MLPIFHDSESNLILIPTKTKSLTTVTRSRLSVVGRPGMVVVQRCVRVGAGNGDCGENEGVFDGLLVLTGSATVSAVIFGRRSQPSLAVSKT